MEEKMDKKRIAVLLADDTLIAREGWKKIIETADDMEVVGEAVSAQETPRKVLELAPDVLLMDLMWFGDPSAGWIAIQEIKASHPKVKVISITAYEELTRDARIAGADGSLTKTFSREDLLGLIRELYSRKESFPAPQPARSPLDDLTPREREVLILLAKGEQDKAIAEALGIAESTAKNHVQKILDKLGAKNRTQAANLAREFGLLT